MNRWVFLVEKFLLWRVRIYKEGSRRGYESGPLIVNWLKARRCRDLGRETAIKNTKSHSVFWDLSEAMEESPIFFFSQEDDAYGTKKK